jgi:hypothetical protein
MALRASSTPRNSQITSGTPGEGQAPVGAAESNAKGKKRMADIAVYKEVNKVERLSGWRSPKSAETPSCFVNSGWS